MTEKEILQYKNECRLLANLPIFAYNVPVYSPVLRDIFDVGEFEYSFYLQLCVLENLNIKVDSQNKYDVLINIHDKDFINMHLEALKFFTRHEFIKMEHQGDIIFVSNEIVLSRYNYDIFIDCIKLANCMSETKVIKRNSELDRKIAEAKAKIKKQLNKENLNDDDITLKDLVSVLTAKHPSLNLLNVWDVNIYQFNDQFKRMQLIENYDIGIRSLLAGAKKEDVKLEHYIKKIKI
jgi:hypothetical protein